MDDFLSYLDDSLGLQVSANAWDLPAKVPMFLRNAADYRLVVYGDIEFVAALVGNSASLPDLKRIPKQLSRYTDLPIVLVGDSIDPRQRRALVAQRVAFVVPGKQAFLPFLAFDAVTRAEKCAYGETLTFRAQGALVTLMANPNVRSSEELREVSGMSASGITRAIDELAQRGFISRWKEGRKVLFELDADGNTLLRRAMSAMQTPVVETFFTTFDDKVACLPDAGESALAERSMLGAPRFVQKAVAKANLGQFDFREILEGELPDADTAQLQVWGYDPLIAGLDVIDDVSLALSLVGENDERINGQLDVLFDEEDLWQ